MTPTLLQTVGFRKIKGVRDTQASYAISSTNIFKLGLASCVVVGFLLASVAFSNFEVQVERRSVIRELRQAERRATAHLAKVEMELWAQFHDDIHESNDAVAVLRSLNVSYTDFNEKIQGRIKDLSIDLNLPEAKTSLLADRVVGLVAQHRTVIFKPVTHLVKHLVENGKKAASLEKQSEKSLDDMMGVFHDPSSDSSEARTGSDDLDDALKNELVVDQNMEDVVSAVFGAVSATMERFSGSTLTKDSEVYHRLQELHEMLNRMEDEGGDDEFFTSLDKAQAEVNLQSVEIDLSPDEVIDWVDVLLRLPDLPVKRLKEMEKSYNTGRTDAFQTFLALQHMASQGQIPEDWLVGQS